MVAVKYEKFDKVRGIGSGCSLATIPQGTLQSLGPSLCLPCGRSVQMAQMSEDLFILIRPQSGARGRMWKRNSDRLDELGVCQNSPPHWSCRHN